ncbi:hypothetical protein Q5M44_10560 [Acinetobacter pittii]|uniref:hypothetical protein n=1 Tax=Acinetobacter pittii TaxID=48296 RepID=UPI0026EA6CE5|nr:hypothetical protein [Acinetobacter pittii]MDO7244970.1 hypothetical protein [Acinetobacter pittii]
MTNDYKEIASFEDIDQSINTELTVDRKYLNFTRYFELPKSSVIENGSSTELLAKSWMSFEKPEDLLFNHGEYITEEGFEHIINELKYKPDSNRALYSLLNYQKICNQGDHPIPSFLLFQVTVEESILYATVYFRAIEVANFLKVNLQEIKLNLLKIIQNSHLNYISKIRLTIHAFNAYKKFDQKLPIIFEIDRLKPAKLSRLLYKSDNHPELIRLIMEKRGAETYISTNWVRIILDELTENSDFIEISKLKDNVENLKHKFEGLLEAYLRLTELRKRVSHSTEIDHNNQEVNDFIDDIVGAIE